MGTLREEQSKFKETQMYPSLHSPPPAPHQWSPLFVWAGEEMVSAKNILSSKPESA